MPTELLLDGDFLLYAAGFAGQKTEYVADTGSAWFRGANQTELAQQIFGDEKAKPSDLVKAELPVYSRVIVDPPEHVYHSCKNMIQTQINETVEKFEDDVHLTIYIDGDGNFRSRYATIRPYKGNRAASSKPVMYNDLRQYLLDVWQAQVVHDQESDDQMAIDATSMQEEGRRVVICGVDKDMLQVPCIHKNPSKGWKKVSKAGGRLFLYRQCLTGDSVDNIQGCYKCGPKAAKTIIPDYGDEETMWKAVVKAYQHSLEKYGSDPYRGLDDPEAIALENMRLVYLRRQPDEIWQPPHKR